MSKKIAVFTTTHETLRAEDIFIEHSLSLKPVIKPRSITSECGMALEFDASLKEQIVNICNENNLELVGIFPQKNLSLPSTAF